MKRLGVIFVGLILYGTREIWGQWSEKDSVWIEDIISGKEQIRLTPEFRQKIESGRLFENEMFHSPLLPDSYSLPIERDFSEYLSTDSTRRPDLTGLPPSVIIRYGLDELIEFDELGSFKLHERDIEILRQLYPGGIKYSMEDILRTIFWKSHRAKKEMLKRQPPGNITTCANNPKNITYR